MKVLWTCALALTTLLGIAATGFCSLAPRNVAVIVNTNSQLAGRSLAVGQYYCEKAGIPATNLIQVDTVVSEQATPTEYADLVSQIRDGLVNELGVDPNDFANDTIQALVMCYGVPTTIIGSYQDANTSVDAFLTLLFNSNPDLGPSDYGCINPYLGKDMDFASFRASADNSVQSGSKTYKMRYMVCRLDAYADPLVTVPEYGTMPSDVKALAFSLTDWHMEHHRSLVYNNLEISYSEVVT